MSKTFDFPNIQIPDLNIPKVESPNIDFSAISSMNDDLSAAMAAIEEQNREEYERKEEVRANTKQMAEDTRVIKELFPQVIQNQNDYIDLLKQQLCITQEQLLQLKNIFYSQEDSDSVQKDILKIISKKGIDLKALSTEKLLDLIIQAIGTYLTQNGIF